MSEAWRGSTVGDRLRWTRKALGLTQVQLCEQAGIAPNAWNNYERRNQRPALDEATKLALCFNISLDWVYMGSITSVAPDLMGRIEAIATGESVR